MIARSTKFVPLAKSVSLSNLKRECSRKKEVLIYNCDEESDREIVIIKDIDCSRVCHLCRILYARQLQNPQQSAKYECLYGL